MPQGNRRGPGGAGPMTGRGAGYCAGYDVPGSMNFVGGAGCRRGFRGRGGYGWGGGGGVGWRHGWGGWGPASYPWSFESLRGPAAFHGAPAPPRVSEICALRDQADQVEGVLNDIRNRISELEKELAKET